MWILYPRILTIRLSFLLKTTESYILLKLFKEFFKIKAQQKTLLDLHFTVHYLLLLFALSEHLSLCTAVSNIYSPNSLSFPLVYPKLKPREDSHITFEIMPQVTS